jgi:hypothetical protein
VSATLQRVVRHSKIAGATICLGGMMVIWFAVLAAIIKLA